MDFEFLETLADARAIRFYELTRLLRLTPAGENSSKLSDELEIGYELFRQLLPLPQLRTENEIKDQVNDLIRPLLADGYVRDFRLKNNNPESTAKGRLHFKFGD